MAVDSIDLNASCLSEQVVSDILPGTRGGHACAQIDSNRIGFFGGASHDAQGYDDLWLLDFGEVPQESKHVISKINSC